MMENLGLAVMMELPCVIVDVNGDLPPPACRRWSGIGRDAGPLWLPRRLRDRCLRAVVAPGNIRPDGSLVQCGQRYRVPVLMMSDEVIGHMIERVVIPGGSDSTLGVQAALASTNGRFDPFLAEDADLVPPSLSGRRLSRALHRADP